MELVRCDQDVAAGVIAEVVERGTLVKRGRYEAALAKRHQASVSRLDVDACVKAKGNPGSA